MKLASPDHDLADNRPTPTKAPSATLVRSHKRSSRTCKVLSVRKVPALQVNQKDTALPEDGTVGCSNLGLALLMDIMLEARSRSHNAEEGMIYLEFITLPTWELSRPALSNLCMFCAGNPRVGSLRSIIRAKMKSISEFVALINLVEKFRGLENGSIDPQLALRDYADGFIRAGGGEGWKVPLWKAS